MAYPISTMIGIRTGGVISGDIDLDDLKERILTVVERINEEDSLCNVYDYNVSAELHGSKGSYVVIAGVFNYWHYDATSNLAKILSKEFETEVMVMTWDEQNNDMQCNVFFAGEPISMINEPTISKILRRTVG